MRGAVWSLELRVALRRRRLLALNAGIPLLLVLPVAAGGAPAGHAAAVYAVLFVLFGTFGSAIPLIRDGERGFLARIRDTGLDDRRHVLERAGAGAAVDAVELLPSLLAAGILEAGPGPGAAAVATLLPVAAVSLLSANLVGAWVAAAARSLAETALFAAVASLFLLHASGVFRTPPPGGFGAALERWAPFRALHEAFLSVATSGPGGPIRTVPPGDPLPLVVSALAILTITGLAAPWILRRTASLEAP